MAETGSEEKGVPGWDGAMMMRAPAKGLGDSALFSTKAPTLSSELAGGRKW